MLVCPRFRNHERLQRAADNSPPLRQGESGDGVAVLQQALVHLGYAMPRSDKGEDFDGIYGPETAATVRKFQQTRALVPDGVAGRETLSTMDRIFLVNDPYFGEPEADRLVFAHQLSGPPGRGPATCTTARKNQARR
jgi:peptidoglycan hydrolase-like protein with peptidoglycan-binding domain